MEPSSTDPLSNGDPKAVRDQVITFPDADEGYSTVLFLGTTGAGKTTLLRHVIGSDPDTDRFPSTSTAKTTTADIEIVTAPGPYRAAVTFMHEDEVRLHIEECLEAAGLEAVQRKPSDRIAAALLEHREQRFRLSYVLGGWADAEMEDSDFVFDDEWETAPEIDEAEAVTREERKDHRARLKDFVDRIGGGG